MDVSWKGNRCLWWRPCDACTARWAEDYASVVANDEATRRAQAERELGDTGLQRIGQFTMDTFRMHLLHTPYGAQHPLHVSECWLAAISDRPHGVHHAPDLPPAALYFYSPGKGRGKTHLAAAIANAVRARGKLVAFLEETSYLERRWGCHFSEIEKLSALPGDRAWLTVIDDLGQRSRASDSVSDAWYALINRRWLKAGWTIFTSNYLPEELMDAGKISEATYSRLMQMIRKQVIYFDGVDQRLA